jgi:hypothetical protein
LGKFSDSDIESMAWIAVDPKHGASELGVERRLVGVHAEAKTQKALVDYITPYYKGIDSAGKGRIAALLEQGDAFSDGGAVTGREFTYNEAVAKGLSDKEATAYLATRSLRMAMYHIRNAELVKHLRSQGYKELEFTGIGLKMPGRELTLESSMGYQGREVFDKPTLTVRSWLQRHSLCLSVVRGAVCSSLTTLPSKHETFTLPSTIVRVNTAVYTQTNTSSVCA